MFVYSVTDRSSFELLTEYRGDIVRTKGFEKVPFVVVGNFSDVEDEREVPTCEGRDRCIELGVPFFETSAETAENCEAAFFELVREIRRRDQIHENQKQDQTGCRCVMC
mmetsp:Transcript_36880/g.85746  ORF Transcript_36880/g.85746 Transcript_36880/m.85746 type:complete len:109 (+) Transcript_36880:383-709(+)